MLISALALLRIMSWRECPIWSIASDGANWAVMSFINQSISPEAGQDEKERSKHVQDAFDLCWITVIAIGDILRPCGGLSLRSAHCLTCTCPVHVFPKFCCGSWWWHLGFLLLSCVAHVQWLPLVVLFSTVFLCTQGILAVPIPWTMVLQGDWVQSWLGTWYLYSHVSPMRPWKEDLCQYVDSNWTPLLLVDLVILLTTSVLTTVDSFVCSYKLHLCYWAVVVQVWHKVLP